MCFLPSFASAQLALALQGFLSRPTCLPPVLAGGSTVNSSLQLQPNKSWSRIPVNCCRAAPLPSLADSESLRAVLLQLLLGRQSLAVPAWTPLAESILQPTCAFKVNVLQSQLSTWASKSMYCHGQSRGHCWTSTRRLTPARRYIAMLM